MSVLHANITSSICLKRKRMSYYCTFTLKDKSKYIFSKIDFKGSSSKFFLFVFTKMSTIDTAVFFSQKL